MSVALTVGVPVQFSRHAVNRYAERVRPGMAGDRLSEELTRVLALGSLVPRPPSWTVWDMRSPLYLELGDVIFPLRAPATAGGVWTAATCLVRGSLSPEARKGHRRSRRAAGRGGSRRKRRKADSKATTASKD
jgi:hypothetical protein